MSKSRSRALGDVALSEPCAFIFASQLRLFRFRVGQTHPLLNLFAKHLRAESCFTLLLQAPPKTLF